MNIRELIEELESLADEHGDNIEVRLAHQPQWPFEYAIGNVVAVDTVGEPDQENFHTEEEFNEAVANYDPSNSDALIVYIGEAGQIGYLPGAAASALGWGR
jgi:hypothetical protein